MWERYLKCGDVTFSVGTLLLVWNVTFSVGTLLLVWGTYYIAS